MMLTKVRLKSFEQPVAERRKIVPISVHDLSIEGDAVLSGTLADEVHEAVVARCLEDFDAAAVTGVLVGVESLHDLILRAESALVKGWKHPS